MGSYSDPATSIAQRKQLLADIERIVAEVADRAAGQPAAIVRTADLAELLHATYPKTGFSIGRIVDEIIAAAAVAKAAVEIDRPRRGKTGQAFSLFQRSQDGAID